jgi:branched-subunit amino acid transport protein
VNIALGLIPLAVLMWAVTYPSRALPMLAPGIERLPNWAIAYLRLAGPAALAALAATACLLTSDSPPRIVFGLPPVAVALCVLITWKTRQLFLGVGAAVVLMALARAVGAA